MALTGAKPSTGEGLLLIHGVGVGGRGQQRFGLGKDRTCIGYASVHAIGTKRNVRNPVAIYVASRRHGDTQAVEFVDTRDAEAVGAVEAHE
eukprot:2298583-Rhodomonas_salina.1